MTFLNPTWPVLRTYQGDHLRAVAMPLGGIGTGCLSLGGRGHLRDWELVNHTSKGFRPRNPFCALHFQAQGQAPSARLLEGPLDASLLNGTTGSPEPLAGLPRFAEAEFHAAYPFAQVTLEDAGVPLDVRLEAFNPMVPGDLAASSWPVAVIRCVLRNRTDAPVRVSVAAGFENFIGAEPWTGALPADHDWPFARINETRVAGGLSGVSFTTREAASQDERWGSLALAVLDPAGELEVAGQTRWRPRTWCSEEIADAWRGFARHGRFDEGASANADGSPVGTLTAGAALAPGEERAFTFLLAWHFPNRHSWVWPSDVGKQASEWVGNHYTSQFTDAWEVLGRFAGHLPALESRTVSWVRAFCASPWPEVLKEAALCNASTLRTPIVFRTPDSHFFGWEGGHNTRVLWNVLGTPPHVWHYEQTSAFLYGGMARSMREINFRHMTDPDGAIRTRVLLPLRRAAEHGIACADSQLGCLLMLWRDWQLSGDDDWMRSLWPQARRAMEFCWAAGSWDADRDGVMEGCQPNTLDIEYFGPNPLMAGLYLAALRATAQMAAASGDADFAGECRRLEASGRKWVEANLWNGDYYEQHIRPVPAAELIDPRIWGGGEFSREHPTHQLGSGCLIDQMLGCYLASLFGLGGVLDSRRVRRTLQSIFRHNHRKHLRSHANHMRTYAVGNEAATLMVTFPRAEPPPDPVPYWSEAMTGFEYTLAAHLLLEGRTAQGIAVARAVRNRHDGRKRNPFDEPEWGHHYARAMSAWGTLLAFTGFQWSAVTGEMRFKALPAGEHFWSTGHAWGTVGISAEKDQPPVLRVIEGKLPWRRLIVGDQAIQSCG